MAPARPAISAIAASAMPLAGHPVADLAPADFLAYLNDLAHVFVADMHGYRYRFAGPIVPFPDMNVRPADSGLPDLYQDIVVTHCRTRNIRQDQAGFRFEFCEGSHGLLR